MIDLEREFEAGMSLSSTMKLASDLVQSERDRAELAKRLRPVGEIQRVVFQEAGFLALDLPFVTDSLFELNPDKALNAVAVRCSCTCSHG